MQSAESGGNQSYALFPLGSLQTWMVRNGTGFHTPTLLLQGDVCKEITAPIAAQFLKTLLMQFSDVPDTEAAAYN